MKVVAEISGNHGGSVTNCLRLIQAAKKAGVDIIKFQHFSPRSLAKKRLNNPAVVDALGHKPTEEELVELYSETWTPLAWWPVILQELGDFPWSCSVFSIADVIRIRALGCRHYKIASFELTDLELIRYVAQMQLPLTISVGKHAKIHDIMEAMEAANGTPHITMLHATPYFLAPLTDSQSASEILDMTTLARDVVHPWIAWGLSDHTRGPMLAIVAKNHGAAMVEKHLRLPDVKTPDAAFSITPIEMEELVKALK